MQRSGQSKLKYICKNTTLENVRIHSLWDTVYSGQSQLTPTLHAHFNHEIQVCTQGNFGIESELGTPITMSENDICLIPRELLHASYPGSAETQKLAFRFYIEEIGTEFPQFDFYNLLRIWLESQNGPIRVHSPQITELIGQIHAKLYDPNEKARVVLELLLIQFFAALFKVLLTNVSTPTADMLADTDNQNARAFKIEDFFSKHYADKIVTEDLAHYLNLSVRQTTREVQRICGVSFREKLIQIRMRQAATLLLRTEMSVNEIAAAVGYTSASGFLVMFRKCYGVAPLAYRRKRKDRMPSHSLDSNNGYTANNKMTDA